MKLWKRFGAVVISVLMLSVMLTGTALAAEPAQDSGIRVQLNGTLLTFTDAVPEAANGRTFLPFRAVFEAMGAEVDYDGPTHTVTARKDGILLSMVPGQKQLTVTENGQTRIVEMDAAPYVKASSGRTYIPVRFAAEALGYSVGWDSRHTTVILVDVDALFGDTTFELMNSFAAYCARRQAGNNMTLTGSLNIDVTDKTGTSLPAPLKIGGSVDGIIGEKGVQLTGKLNLTGLSELVEALGQEVSPMELLMIRSILSSLSNLSAEVRMDLDKWMVYASLPAELTGMENTWYSVDLGAYRAQLLGALDMTKMTQLKEAGLRDCLVWVMENLPLNDADTSYDTLAMMAKLYSDLLGDQAFVQKGNTYVAQTTLEDIVPVTLTFTKRGNDIVAVDIKMEFDSSALDAPAESVSMKMTEHAAPDKVTVEMEMAMETGEADMKFSLNLSCVPTGKAPVTAPPAGAQIIPLS